jgi:hypothetical protein
LEKEQVTFFLFYRGSQLRVALSFRRSLGLKFLSNDGTVKALGTLTDEMELMHFVL